jgi:putative membrane protein
MISRQRHRAHTSTCKLDGEKETMLTIHSSRILALATVAAASTFAAASVAGAQASPSVAAKLDDPTIVAIFDAANTWDIETGQIAVKKGSNKEVRDFGAMLARDHRMVRQQGRDLAKKLNVTPTPPQDFAMAKDHQLAVAKLNGLSGKEFDRAFLQHEVDYHKAVLDAVTTTLLPALQNQEVKDLVTKVAPAFTAHMQAAQNLLNKQSAN